MVELKQGTIFDSDAEVLVNTVNCVGVMGAGVALRFRIKYQGFFEQYKKVCDKGLLRPGVLWWYNTPDGKRIMCFPTKTHWKYPSKIEYIELGMRKFVECYKKRGVKTIAFPLLGCSNGRLDPEMVIPLMVKYLEKCDGIEATIYDDRKTISIH